MGIHTGPRFVARCPAAQPFVIELVHVASGEVAVFAQRGPLGGGEWPDEN